MRAARPLQRRIRRGPARRAPRPPPLRDSTVRPRARVPGAAAHRGGHAVADLGAQAALAQAERAGGQDRAGGQAAHVAVHHPGAREPAAPRRAVLAQLGPAVTCARPRRVRASPAGSRSRAPSRHSHFQGPSTASRCLATCVRRTGRAPHWQWRLSGVPESAGWLTWALHEPARKVGERAVRARTAGGEGVVGHPADQRRLRDLLGGHLRPDVLDPQLAAGGRGARLLRSAVACGGQDSVMSAVGCHSWLRP